MLYQMYIIFQYWDTGTRFLPILFLSGEVHLHPGELDVETYP